VTRSPNTALQRTRAAVPLHSVSGKKVPSGSSMRAPLSFQTFGGLVGVGIAGDGSKSRAGGLPPFGSLQQRSLDWLP